MAHAGSKAVKTAFPEWPVAVVIMLWMLLGPQASQARTQTLPSERQSADTLRFVAPSSLVITATRSEKAVEDIAVPTTVLPASTLQRQGSLRLSDVMASIPGMVLTDDHGTGVQLQGLSPDYTLILLNGEPVIGRNAGTLDLQRLSVRGLDRVEIVKGPSSSLYGSEALAGVINLITLRPNDSFEGSAQVRHGTHATSDATLDLGTGGERHGIRMMVNRFSSQGYDLHPDRAGWTAPAFSDYTADVRGVLWKGGKVETRLGARGSRQEQQGLFALRSFGGNGGNDGNGGNEGNEGNGGNGGIIETRYDDLGSRSEWSLHPEVEIRWKDGLRTITSAYGSGYEADVDHRSQSDGSILYTDRYSQTLRKAEQRAVRLWNERHLSIGGGGYLREELGGSRYGDASTPSAGQWFAYLQHEWIPSQRLELNGSARYDAHSDYQPRLSPKISMLFKATESLRVRASIGSGFKAPAFRQLYLSFSNSNAGYSVFGSERMREGLRRLQDQGQIESLLIDVDRLQGIGAEHSVAVNAGLSYSPTGNLRVDLNAFHNDVRDMIETQPVAIKANGQYVFGYFNLEEIYTRGVQLDVTWIAGGGMGTLPFSARIDAGYQFLQAHDRAIVRDIREGTVFGRDPRGRDTRIGMDDYSGLLGRSAHSGSLRLTITDPAERTTLSTRLRWRGKYGYRDLDGNQFANRSDEFIPGHAVVDVTLTRDIALGRNRPVTTSASNLKTQSAATSKRRTTLQIGSENLFGTTFPDRLPSLDGRRLSVGASIHF